MGLSWIPSVYVSWSTSEQRMMLSICETGLSPRVKYFYCASLVDHLCLFSVLYLLCFCACLFIDALWSLAGSGLTSWLSFVMFNCEVDTFPLVSWVRCGAWLYRFLIFALFLTSIGALWVDQCPTIFQADKQRLLSDRADVQTVLNIQGMFIPTYTWCYILLWYSKCPKN